MSNSFLPHGLQLKSLLVGSLLTDSDLKRFLNDRGIFVGSSDKDVTVPILTTLLLTPNEFEKLKINQVAHEDSLKHVTRWIKFPRADFSLLDVLETLNLDESILPLHRNYEIEGAPSFRGNPDAISMDIQLVRENPQKSWVEHKSKHNARVSLEKHDNNVKILLEWSTPETRDVTNALVSNVRQQLVRKGIVDRSVELRTVNAGAFTNEERIKKLLAFTANHPAGFLRIDQVTHVNMGPDDTKTLPEELRWMENRVRSMLLRGKQLHSVDFLVKDELLPYVILDGIELCYKYDLNGESGTCVVLLGFNGFLKSKNLSTEFEMCITRISLSTNKKGAKFPKSSFNRKRTEDNLLRLLDEMKSNIFG